MKMPLTNERQGHCRPSKKSIVKKQDAMKGGQPFIFNRIDRLCRSGGAIFRSVSVEKSFPQHVDEGLTCQSFIEKGVEKLFRHPEGLPHFAAVLLPGGLIDRCSDDGNLCKI